MFCFKCGKQIRDDSVFCQYCGTPQNKATGTGSVARKASNGELDRDALKIYLGNILSLECIKANYKRKIDDANKKIFDISISHDCRFGRDYYDEWCVIRSDSTYLTKVVHLLYDGKNYYIAYEGSFPMTSRISNWDCTWRQVDLNVHGQSSVWENSTYGGYFARSRQLEQSREGFLKAYSQFTAEAPAKFQKKYSQVNRCKRLISGITNELKSIDKLLSQAYALNIIPNAFRNLHAVYYLHNFASTSRESLTTALLHCDLDTIKSKLDRIISQQEEIIIQQAVMSAQNKQLLRQNQQQLEYLSKTESNTSQAAQYAQIAANNAAACAWIGMANYIESRSRR